MGIFYVSDVVLGLGMLYWTTKYNENPALMKLTLGVGWAEGIRH